MSCCPVWGMWATQVEMFACDPSNTLSKCEQAQGQSNEKHSEKQSKHYFILLSAQLLLKIYICFVIIKKWVFLRFIFTALCNADSVSYQSPDLWLWTAA